MNKANIYSFKLKFAFDACQLFLSMRGCIYRHKLFQTLLLIIEWASPCRCAVIADRTAYNIRYRLIATLSGIAVRGQHDSLICSFRLKSAVVTCQLFSRSFAAFCG